MQAHFGKCQARRQITVPTKKALQWELWCCSLEKKSSSTQLLMLAFKYVWKCKWCKQTQQLWNTISITVNGQSISMSIIAFCPTVYAEITVTMGKGYFLLLWVKKTQFDKQLAAAIAWWCYHVQNRSPVWGKIFKWGLKIFFLLLFCSLLFCSHMRKIACCWL